MRQSFFALAALALLAAGTIAWMGANRFDTRDDAAADGQTVAQLVAITRKSPDNVEAWKSLAKAYRREGQVGQAVTAYVRAARIDPTDPEIIRALRDLAEGLDRT